MAAGNAWLDHDFGARLDPGNQFTDFTNDTGNIVAKDVRQWNPNASQSGSRPNIQMVERTRLDFNEDFVRFDFGGRNVGVLQDIWSTVLIKDNGFHDDVILDVRVAIAKSKVAQLSCDFVDPQKMTNEKWKMMNGK